VAEVALASCGCHPQKVRVVGALSGTRDILPSTSDFLIEQPSKRLRSVDHNSETKQCVVPESERREN
jgi:hypothetical protein